MNYIGIDHHKQYSHMTVMGEDGKIIKTGKVVNFRIEIEKFLEGLIEEAEAVIESGRSSYVMLDLMEELGARVKLGDSKQIKAIARARIKTDKRSSEVLAHLLRTDLIPEVYRRDEENRRAQRVLRQRAFFVGTQTRVKNRIRALLAQQKEELQVEVIGEKNLFGRKGMDRLKQLGLPSTDKELLGALLKLFRHLYERIRESNDLVERLYSQLKPAQLIRTVPGFGKFFSVLVVTEIGDIKRFSSVSKLHSYAGVIPSTYSSGERSYHGRIIKEGNVWLRWAAVEAVWPAVRSDFDIDLYYKKLKKRKSSNAAKVATARRLLTIIYHILNEERCYVPYMRKRSVAFSIV